jgi:hypothetical protein
VPLERFRDGKKIGEKILQDRVLSHLMPASFLRDFGQQHDSLTVSASLAAADRSRYISKGDLHDIVD